MNNKKILLPAFIVLAMVQLYIPAKMIYNQEEVLKSGKKFKFKIEPIDPSDPLRGKYITLNFKADTVHVHDAKSWQRHTPVYLRMQSNEKGFATIDKAFKEPPQQTKHYVKANIRYFINDDSTALRIKYPFNRYYVKEHKAKEAEKAYDEARWGDTEATYALVSVKDGRGVIKNLIIEGVPLKHKLNKPEE